MYEKIKIHYLIVKEKDLQVISLQAYIDTSIIDEINHKKNEYYIGFSGFDEKGKVVGTTIRYDFYYFYNMVEDIMVITDSLYFTREIRPEELLIIETNRIKKLKEQKNIATLQLFNRLKTYEIYKAEMKDWISENGSEQLRVRFAFNEDVELSYLIERINIENLKIKTSNMSANLIN